MARRPAGDRNLDAILRMYEGADLDKMFSESISPGVPYDNIGDFVLHPSFLGKQPYPRQLTLMRLIYLETENMTAYDIDTIEEWRRGFGKRPSIGIQPDIWERVKYLKANGYRRFPTIINVSGRRSGKGFVGGVLGAETACYLVSLDNPQQHYGIEQGKDLYANIIAQSSTLAKQNLFADIRTDIQNCGYLKKYIATSNEQLLTLRTANDVRRILRLKEERVPMDSEIASIRFKAQSTTSGSGRGAAAFANLYDELGHLLTGTDSDRTAESIVTAFQPALDQLGRDAFTYVPSSPYQKMGPLWDFYQSGSVEFVERNTESGLSVLEYDDSDDLFDPEILILQLPSWNIYEDWDKSADLIGIKKEKRVQHPPSGDTIESRRMSLMKKQNPDKFRVEREAQFAETINPYLDPDMVDKMFVAPEWYPDLTKRNRGRMDVPYHIHCDPAKVNDNFSMVVSHLEKDTPPDENGVSWPVVVVDHIKVWKPKDFPEGRINYVNVIQDIKDTIRAFPTTEMVSFDQFDSQAIMDTLKAEFPGIKIKEVTFTVQSNQRRFESFKSILNHEWVKSYKDNYFENGFDSLLEQEMKFLRVKNGKVDHQTTGPVKTKDVFDCLAVNATRLLQESLERMSKMLAGLDIVPAASPAQVRDGSAPDIYASPAHGLSSLRFGGHEQRRSPVGSKMGF